MGAARQRKIDARARRQESLRNQGKPTTIETEVKLPQPKNLVKGGIVKVSEDAYEKDSIEKIIPLSKKIEKGFAKKLAKKGVEVIVKRGRGRPPKSVTTTKKSAMGSVKKPTISKKGKK